MKVIYRIFFIFILFLSFLYSSSMDVNLYKSYINSQIDMREIPKTFDNKPIPPLKKRVIPKYATAWPKKVKVLKPDPVLGDKDVWEHWIYNEEFAKRFEGFDVEKADVELKNSPIKAITLRIYKDNLWKGSLSSLKQYTCNINIFFDSSIKIPLMNKKLTQRFYKSTSYPKGITSGYDKLIPINKKDKNIYKNKKATSFYLNTYPLILTNQPLDGRFNALSVNEYIPNFIKNVSVINLKSLGSGFCEIVAPIKKDGLLQLSLFGKNPYFDNKITLKSKTALRGLYDEKIIKNFPKNFDFESNGFFKLPNSYYKIALEKAVLIKNLNNCISRKSIYEENKYKKYPHNIEKEISSKREIYFSLCEKAELNGEIFDPRYIDDPVKRHGFHGIKF
jgi:hypothetical protein